MVDSEIPCPLCGESLVLDISTVGQEIVCPACDALVPMPKSPSSPASSTPAPFDPFDPAPSAPAPSTAPSTPAPAPGPIMSPAPSQPATAEKRAVPSRRPEGEKPRSFSDQPPDPTSPPRTDAPLAPPSPELLANRPKATLPSQRQRDRQLPTLTPAVYQSEQPASPSTQPGVRAELPERRTAEEKARIKLTPPQPEKQITTPSKSTENVSNDFDTNTPAPPHPTENLKPANHRLGGARMPEMKRQETVEFDPEVTAEWGQDKEDPETAQRGRRRLLLWGAAIAIPLVSVVVWQSVFKRGFESLDSIRPSPTPAGSNDDAAAESRLAGAFVTQFLAASTIEERAALVRHPDITRPRMEKWYNPTNPLKAQKLLELHDISSEQTIDGITFLLLSMDLDDFTQRAIAVEKRPDGSFLIDWESFVFWSEMRWPEFLSKEPQGSQEFRVSVEIDSYFNFGYENPQQWFCYKLTDPENWAHCWGYCDINSEVGSKINRMIRRQRQQGEDKIKAILKLKFDDAGRGRSQVIIEDVMQDGWVKPGD